ncbi:MAG: ROK family protein [Dehalococcoidales bacterium]|nr:ROK family protein [Dehalococcoidales bacterium]
MARKVESDAPILAVDLGGTKIMVALVSSSGQIIARERTLTPASEGPGAVIDRLCSTIGYLLGEKNVDIAGLHSISMAVAGVIDSERGLVTLSPNLSGWRDVPLRDIVAARLGIRTFLVNDASAAALGEHQFGAGRGVRDLVLLTVGTGIGGGIIIDGHLYLGASGAAGEMGHMTIDINGPKCPCGNTGCLEMLASGTAIAREAIRCAERGQPTSLIKMASGKLAEITAEKVSAAAKEGDSVALRVINTAATYLGVGLVNLVNIFNPEMIIIGGGVAKMGGLLLEPARQVVRERAFVLPARVARIVPAQLDDDAGVLGAAAFAFQQ